MNNSYARIANFGPSSAPPCEGTNNPLTYCLVDTMDKDFQHAPNGVLYGPRSEKCQLYMSERCAKNWDGYCEYFYKTKGPNGEWPYNQRWPNMGEAAQTGLSPASLTTGEQLLQDTAQRRFCKFASNCKKCEEPFDPMNPQSERVYKYRNTITGGKCVPVCSVDPSSIDNDPVMDRLLTNPSVGAGTLINICNTSRNLGVDLSGTKVGRLCQGYFDALGQ